jgi:hypothetical protein
MMLKGLFAAHSQNFNCARGPPPPPPPLSPAHSTALHNQCVQVGSCIRSYDPTAAFIATGGDDGLVRLWERGVSAAKSIAGTR